MDIQVNTKMVNGKKIFDIDDNCIISKLCADDDDTYKAIEILNKAHCDCTRDGIEFRAQIETDNKDEAMRAIMTMQDLRNNLQKQRDQESLTLRKSM